MPFVAERSGEAVVPEEVSDGARLTCPDCNAELCVRPTHLRNGSFVARHFMHVSGGENCSGGESETHRRLKSIILSKLKYVFEYAEAGLEKKIGRNIADVYAIFEKPIKKFGKGVAVEVQYRNDGKDVVSVTRNYLEEGYSVCWIEEADIDGKDVDLSSPEWFYVHELEYYEQNTFLQMRYEMDTETGYPKPPLYCPDCYGPVKLKEIEQEDPVRGIGGDIYGCPRCSDIFENSYVGPVTPIDYYGNHTLAEYSYDGDQSLETISSDVLSCPSCLGDVRLHEAQGVSHAYEGGPVYQCPRCESYFLESEDSWRSEKVEQVTHEGNLTHEPDWF